MLRDTIKKKKNYSRPIIDGLILKIKRLNKVDNNPKIFSYIYKITTR